MEEELHHRRATQVLAQDLFTPDFLPVFLAWLCPFSPLTSKGMNWKGGLVKKWLMFKMKNQHPDSDRES